MARGEAVTGLSFSRHVHRPTLEIFGPAADVSTDPPLGEATRQQGRETCGTLVVTGDLAAATSNTSSPG
jgi:hypothetical protein